MAEVKPLYSNTEGFPQEMATTDTLQVGGMTVNTGNIVMSGGTVTGLPTPTGATEATPKSYVDSLVQGLRPRQGVKVASNNEFDTFTAAGSGVGATLTSADDATSNNDVDGVTLSVGDRVLVWDFGGGSSHADNGIYELTTAADGGGQNAIYTRTTDFDEDAEVTQGDFVVAAEGTLHAKKGFVLLTDDPITVDTTAQQWEQLFGPGNITAGAGLLDTSNTFSVELDTDADADSAGNGGGSSGLEFDVAGDGGQLRVAVNGAAGINRGSSGIEVIVEADGAIVFDGTNGGLEISLETTNPTLDIVSNELGVKFSATTSALEQTASGLGVVVDGVTISINGSNELVALGSDESSRVENDINLGTGGSVAAGDPVYVNAADTVIEADNTVAAEARRVIGVAAAAQTTVGQPVRVVSNGRLDGVGGGGFTAGTYIFLDTPNGLTQTKPTASGSHVVLVGHAINTNDMMVRIEYVNQNA